MLDFNLVSLAPDFLVVSTQKWSPVECETKIAMAKPIFACFVSLDAKKNFQKLEMLRSIVSPLASPTSLSSLICNPNLSLYYFPITN